MGIDNKRAVYFLAVAHKMRKLTEEAHPGDRDLAQDMFLLGLVHGVAEEFSDLEPMLPKLSGDILKDNGYKYWEEAAHFGYYNFKSEAHDILSKALLTTSEDGEEITVEEKLEELSKSIMGVNSNVYMRYKDLAIHFKLLPQE